MTDIDKVVIGTRRRLLSDDFNNGERLRDRALLETIAALTTGDVYKLASDGLGGVIGGLTVRAVVGSNEVEVQPGIALINVTPASATYDPAVQWIELKEPTRIDLGPDVDGGNPRLVTIEIAPGSAALVTSQVDVFDPVTGGFTSAAQDRVTGSVPVISSRAGAAAASPVVAPGPGSAATLPLAVVKLEAGQASFVDAFVPVLMRRPLLAAAGGLIVTRGAVEGGGFSVGEESGGAIVGTDQLEVNEFRAELNGLVASARGAVSMPGPNVMTISGTTIAGLMGTVQPIHMYAVEPPWAIGDYGSIAPCEAVASNPNGLNLFTTNQSVVGGQGSTFQSLFSFNNLTSFTFSSMVMLADTAAPAGLLDGASSNAASKRVSDVRGPHPTTAAGSTITLDATQDPTWGPSQIVSKSVYLGTVSSLGTGTRLMGQSYRGRGRVRVIDDVDFAGTSYRPAVQSNLDTGVLDPIYPGRYPAMTAGNAPVVPLFCSRVEVGAFVSNNGGAGTARLILKGAYGFGPGEPNPELGIVIGRFPGADLTTVFQFGDPAIGLDLDETGQAFIYATIAGGGARTVILEAYEDPILASR